MYIIVGLGNPTREYENTRHNVGFEVIDALAGQEGIRVLEKKFKAVLGKGFVAGEPAILARPQTYMNLSGESVRELTSFYKVDEKSQLIIVSDDVNLELGQIRIRKKGSAGGHNGLKNIIAALGHEEFIRVRMGVGQKPERMDLANFVLGHFTQSERKAMDEAEAEAAEAIRVIVKEGPDAAMNRFNKKNA